MRDFTRSPQLTPAMVPMWNYKKAITSDIGDFSLTLQTNKNETPDPAMFVLARELISFATTHTKELLTIAFQRYTTATRNDPDWVRSLGVPLNLRKEQIAAYLVAPHDLLVDRFDPTHSTHILLRPRWDEEHGIFIRVTSGRVSAVDGVPRS